MFGGFEKVLYFSICKLCSAFDFGRIKQGVRNK